MSLSRSEHLNCARLLPDCLAASKTQSLAEQGVVSELGFDGHKPDKPAEQANKEDGKGAAGGEGREAKKGEGGSKPAKGKRPTADPTAKTAPKGRGGGKTSKGEGFVL